MLIRLNGIELFAYHGVYEEEIKTGNHFEVDLEVEVNENDLINDELSDVLDYVRLYNTVILVSDKLRYNLLETFAADICTHILQLDHSIEYVRVKVRKLNPPMAGKVKNVEIEIEKRKPDA